MTDGGFKFQVNVKVGNDLLNVRADSADEFRTNIDALFGDGASLQVLTPYFAQAALKQAPTVETSVVGSTPLTGEAPTEKQVAFAIRLGIDPAGKTKAVLSSLIEAKVNG